MQFAVRCCRFSCQTLYAMYLCLFQVLLLFIHLDSLMWFTSFVAVKCFTCCFTLLSWELFGTLILSASFLLSSSSPTFTAVCFPLPIPLHLPICLSVRLSVSPLHPSLVFFYILSFIPSSYPIIRSSLSLSSLSFPIHLSLSSLTTFSTLLWKALLINEQWTDGTVDIRL